MTTTTTASGERFARANGLDLCYETFGDASKPPVVLIMGLGAQMISWDAAFCAELAAQDFFVVRFDNRDIGRSTRLDAPVPNVMAMLGMAAIGRTMPVPYLLSDMAADTVGLMDALGLRTAHIVGASMGGAIAQDIAIRYPSRVRSLTCIMATTGAANLPPPSAEAIAVLLRPSPLDLDAYLVAHRETIRVLRGPHVEEDPEHDRQRAIRSFERGLSPAGVARQLAAIMASGDRTAALASVTAPTLVIHGDADPLVRVEAGRAIVAAVGKATIDVIKGMGHTLPRVFWSRIIADIALHARTADAAAAGGPRA
jgi:pimeloyl-ACP methyl ester carboxylesterase